MPPVDKAGGSAFRKDVEFVGKDSDEQLATGIVMVPDTADLQNDFAREDTIRTFAEQFAAFEDVGQAGGGIMHAVWPDGWMALERNEVLDAAEEIGGETVEAGAWVQTWSIDNADLWGLIEENILEGYSIGAIQVDWNGPFEPDSDEVENVDTSAIPDDEMVWELTDGIIREVSAVDIPAVPDAEILEAKADADKRLADHLGNRDGFIEEAMERGHSEAEAERLWEVLNEAVEADGSTEPGKQSLLHRAGKAFLSALTGSDGDGDETGSSPTNVGVVADAMPSETADRDTDKEGRTLSQANQESIMASIDAGLDALHDAGVEDLPKRFTDRDDVEFDLSEHDAREWAGDHDDEDEADDSFFAAKGEVTKGENLSDFLEPLVEDAAEEDDVDEADIIDRIAEAAGMDSSTVANIVSGDIECPPRERFDAFAEELDATVEEMIEAAREDGCEYEDVSASKDAPDGDTSDADMSDDNNDTDTSDEPPEWAKSLIDTVEENSKQIEELAAQKKTATFEIDGETVELTEAEVREKFNLGDDDATLEGAPAWAKSLVETVEKNSERIDQIATQSGHSQQLGGPEKNGADETDEVEAFKSQLVGGRTGRGD